MRRKSAKRVQPEERADRERADHLTRPRIVEARVVRALCDTVAERRRINPDVGEDAKLRNATAERGRESWRRDGAFEGLFGLAGERSHRGTCVDLAIERLCRVGD